MKGLDLRKFHKVSEDDEFTTMRHYAGHEIRVAHKKLSKAHKSQLDRLPMAKGGPINDIAEAPTESAAAMQAGFTGKQAPAKKKDQGEGYSSTPVTNHPSPDPDAAKNKSYQDQAKAFNKKLGGYAEGGKVKQYAEGTPDGPISSEMPPVLPPDEAIAADAMAAPQQDAPNKYAGVYDDRMSFYKQNTPGTPTQTMEGDALAEAERIKNIDTYKAGAAQTAASADHDKAVAENQRRAALGIAPIEVPTVGSPQEATRAPVGSPSGPVVPTPTETPVSPPAAPNASEGQKLISDFDRQTREQARILQDSAKQQDQLIQEAAATHKATQDEYINFVNDIKQQHIDPDRLWNSKSDAGKAATILGIMLAGFSPAARPNAAIEELDKAIDRDIDSQKAELGKKNTLLSANMQHFKDLSQATEMTRVMQMGAVSEKMKAAAAKAGDPVNKAKMLEDITKYDQAIAARVDKLGQQRALAGVYAAAKDPAKTESAIAALERVDPKAGAEMRAKYVPGLGLANTDKDATDLKEMKSSLDSAKGGIKELLAMTHKTGKSLSPTDRANAEVIQQSLVGLLRLPITGPGAMNEGERKMLERMIANPTNIFSLDSTNRAKLNTLSAQLDMKLDAAAKARGVSVPAKTAEAQTQTMGGVKYVKVPGGWKKAE